MKTAVWCSLFAVFVSNACAEIAFKDKCYVFTGESGKKKEVKFCPDMEVEIEYYKPAIRSKADGKTWDLIARSSGYSARLMPDSRSSFVYVQTYSERPAMTRGPGGKPEEVFGSGVISKGYRLRYFGGDGRLLWDKSVSGEGQIRDQKISYDGSLVVLLIQSDVYSVKSSTEKPSGSPEHWITVYNNKGVRLLDFPKRADDCRFHSLYDLWISKTGKYIMAACRDNHKINSCFIQPRSRKLWSADQIYKIDWSWKGRVSGTDNPWTDEDEEYGRLDLDVSVDGKIWERTYLVLNGVDWQSVE